MTDLELREVARVAELMRTSRRMIFVFGSNRRGLHGAGAAKTAETLYGAKPGVGEGLSGRSYAIPTKETWRDDGLPLKEVARHVTAFLRFAESRPDLRFAITRVGCGYAGFTDEEIAPLFVKAPENCYLPEGWA